MKFCVMKAAQSNAVFDIALVIGEERDRQNVMRLQLRFASANAATAVSLQNGSRPFFATAPLSKAALTASVDIIGIARATMPLRYNRRLSAPSRSGARTLRAIAVAVFIGFERGVTHAAPLPLDS